jgi:hypothetical protein
MDMYIEIDGFLNEHATKLSATDHAEATIFTVPVILHGSKIIPHPETLLSDKNFSIT